MNCGYASAVSRDDCSQIEQHEQVSRAWHDVSVTVLGYGTVCRRPVHHQHLENVSVECSIFSPCDLTWLEAVRMAMKGYRG